VVGVARVYDDCRLFRLQALVTPGVLVNTSDAEFMLPTRMGLVLSGVVALASAITFSPARNARLWSCAGLCPSWFVR
jgi:hypothetical protein